MTHLRRALILTLAALIAATVTISHIGTPTPAQAEIIHVTGSDPIYIGWSSALPAWTTAYEPSSEDDCIAGRAQCTDKTLREMRRRYDQFAATCDHRAVFALTYLRTTEEFAKAVAEPGFFTDPRFLNHQDAVFAQFYFTAYDDWAAGRTGVPPAWQRALDATSQKKVSTLGDVKLAMNAHIARDLPFVLRAIGLTTPEGTSRKPDHDQVNVFLNRVMQPLLDELAAKYDPVVNDAKSPLGISYTALMQFIMSLREQAWRNAERLATAPNEASRAAVAADIETAADNQARTIIAANAYAPPLTTTEKRDAYCAAQL